MKTLNLTIAIIVLLMTISFGQNQAQSNSSTFSKEKNEVEMKHSIGSSLWMLYNLSEESADYALLTYGYQPTGKDRIFIEYNTWKYQEPMGTYGSSEELYPGYIRTHGIGLGYQRFHWKGLFNSIQATNFRTQYHDGNDERTQGGYQLYLQLAVGYRFEFFKKRLYVEPAYALKYWPVNTNMPEEFKKIAEGTPLTIVEPSLNFGFKF